LGFYAHFDKSEIIGLLQINDKKEGAFEEDIIPVIENICNLFGEIIGPLLETETEEETKLRSMMAKLEESIEELQKKINIM